MNGQKIIINVRFSRVRRIVLICLAAAMFAVGLLLMGSESEYPRWFPWINFIGAGIFAGSFYVCKKLFDR